ncbi:putative xylogalacturonan beta-1,3-xylosyltransferase [Helianthus annuus]|nr:putative xylogalacturonan beta-1,3-xylosyltransferase [Helianthus annuus]
MDQRFGFIHYLYQKQTIKWICLFGIASAVLMTVHVQYSQPPIIRSFSFILSGAKPYDLKDSYSAFNGSVVTDQSTQNASSLTNLSTVDNEKPDMESLSVLSILQMNELLRKSHSARNSVPSHLLSRVDQQLLEAKSRILNANVTHNDMDLYAPIYRNISMFKRSYEIMEQMLKVYIYKDGEKPIFHDWILEGIYACEGWFLKLMEANKQFVTHDPNEAHLFYIPFSSRLLQQTLYVRHSHSRDNLIQFMKNHTEMLMTKYPFWNRTNGSDHFLAACHDWAPAETRGRLLNTIRALCNADIQTGFQIGKDVSLPTTYVQSATNPLKTVGGAPPSNRPTLAFFAGFMHGNVRPVLLSHWGNDTDMKIFSRLPHVKVFDVLNWESFAVFILEKEIPDLKRMLLSISHEKYVEMYERVKRVQEHFFWHSEPVKYDLFHMILHSVWYNRVFTSGF